MSLTAQMRSGCGRTVGPAVVAALRHGHVQDLIETLREKGLSSEDEQDLKSAACLRLFAYARTHRVAKPRSLLRRIILNLWITSVTQAESATRRHQDVDALDHVPDPRPGPERIVAAEQEIAQVADLLSAGSTRTCQMFLAQRGGYTYEEVAAGFAIKSRTVEKHVATAEDMLLEHGGLKGDPWPPAPGRPYLRRRQLQGLADGRMRAVTCDAEPYKTEELTKIGPLRHEIFPADRPRYPKAERSGRVSAADPWQLQDPAERITGPPYSGHSAGSWGIRKLHVLTAAPSRVSSGNGEGRGGVIYGPDDDDAK
jgi:DNA-directed RNA polymerase specialized sigma24 family protein